MSRVLDPSQLLPTELCLMILAHLDPTSFASVCKVCRHWSIFGATDSIWKDLHCRESWLYTVDSKSTPNSVRSDLSWKSAYATRRRLEANWYAGKYSESSLNSGFKISAMRLQGQFLFTGDTDGTIRRWNLASGTLNIPPFGRYRTEVRSMELDPLDVENVLVCGHRSGALAVWQISTGQLLQWLKQAHDKSIETIRLSDRFLVTGSVDNRIKVWSRQDGAWGCALRPVWTLVGHTAFVSALYLSGDNLISSSPGDCSIRTWDLKTGCCVWSYTGPGSVAYAHLDGQGLCVGSQMRLYDERLQRQVSVLSDPQSVTLAAQAVFRGAQLARLITAGSRGCTIWKEVAGSWVEQHRLVEDSGSQKAADRNQKTSRVLRHLQVDVQRFVCSSGSRIVMWDFS